MVDITTGFSERDIIQLVIALLLQVSGIDPATLNFGVGCVGTVEVPELVDLPRLEPASNLPVEEPFNSRHPNRPAHQPRFTDISSRFHPYRKPTSAHLPPRRCVECSSFCIGPNPPHKCAECGSINTNRFGHKPVAWTVTSSPSLPAILTAPFSVDTFPEAVASPASPQAASPIAAVPAPELSSFTPSSSPDLGYEYSVSAEDCA